jgi:cell division transport system permease protein
MGFMSAVPLRREASVMRALSAAVTAIMVALAILVLAGAAALRHLDVDWRRALTERWTVELDAANPADMEHAVAALRALPGVADAQPVPPEEIHRLLRPWLGDDKLAAQLPLPTLIDLKTNPGAPVPASVLRSQIAAALPGARLDDHESWTGDLLGLARSGEALGIALFAAIALTAAATIAATARARLAANSQEIALLHILGATDGYIARRFQAGPLRSALLGALVGSAIAAGVIFLFSQAASPALPLIPQLTLSLADLAALAVVPVGAVLLAMLVSALTAYLMARRIP